MLEIRQASEKDIPVIEGILLEAARWLESTGKPLWSENEVRWERLSRQFASSDFYIGALDGEPAACVAVVDFDPVLWPDIEKGASLFVHKLAVRRFAAGRGLSDDMLDFAKAMCEERGIKTLRLDCHGLMPKLRAVYERNGFVCVAEKFLFDRYHIAFYEYYLP